MRTKRLSPRACAMPPTLSKTFASSLVGAAIGVCGLLFGTAHAQVELGKPPSSAGNRPSFESLAEFAKQPPDASLPPLPDAAALNTAMAGLKEVLADELKAAKTPEDRSRVAGTLLLRFSDEAELPVRAAAIQLAIDLSAEGGDADKALRGVQTLSERFRVSKTLAGETLLKAMTNCKLPEQRSSAVKASLPVVRALVEAEEVKLADEVSKTALGLASRLKGEASVADELRAIRAELTDRLKQQQAIDAAVTKLATAPDDPAANQQVGLYFCFQRADWENGLKHLAKASDAKLQNAAKLEQAAFPEDSSVEARVASAEAWVDAAGTQPIVWKNALKEHAIERYREANEKATSLLRVKITKNLAALEAEVKAGKTKLGSTGKSTRPGTTKVGLIGRGVIGREDIRLVFIYTPGGEFSHDQLMTALRDAKISDEMIQRMDLTIELHGVLKLPRETKLSVWHRGGSAAGGRDYLYVDNRELNRVGDDYSKNRTDEYTIPAGTHAIRWRLKGGHFGGGNAIKFTDPATGNEVPIEYDRAMLSQMKQLPTSAEVVLPPALASP